MLDLICLWIGRLILFAFLPLITIFLIIINKKEIFKFLDKTIFCYLYPFKRLIPHYWISQKWLEERKETIVQDKKWHKVKIIQKGRLVILDFSNVPKEELSQTLFKKYFCILKKGAWQKPLSMVQ